MNRVFFLEQVYSLSGNDKEINEGGIVTFTLTTRNVEDGTKISVIIDPFFLEGQINSSSTYKQSGILALNNVVGPGFVNSNRNGDLPN